MEIEQLEFRCGSSFEGGIHKGEKGLCAKTFANKEKFNRKKLDNWNYDGKTYLDGSRG